MRRSYGIPVTPPPAVIPLDNRVRVTVAEPDLGGTWLVQIAGTTADPSVFPPDRTLPTVSFDFRDLDLNGEEPDDPFAPFRSLIRSGLTETFRNRSPEHIVFVGHSFGGMASIDFLLREGPAGLRQIAPSVQHASLVMLCAAHRSPMDRYRVRSDAPVVGPLLTWLSHYLTRAAAVDRRVLKTFKDMIGSELPRELWREHWQSTDELGGFWDMPKAASLDHFWSVIQCARQYDIRTLVGEGRRFWFDTLVMSAERDASWPADLYTEFWELLLTNGCNRARWCHFPGDDHLAVVRQPTKYYKEIRDFLVSSRFARELRV